MEKKMQALEEHHTYKDEVLDRAFFKPFSDLLGGKVRAIFCTADSPQEAHFRFFKTAFSCPFYQRYGMSEVPATSLSKMGEIHWKRTGSNRQVKFKLRNATDLGY
jgi:long-subunit acyl-CoA synthetase (AMP-forming)